MEFLKKSIKVDLYSIKSYRKWFIKIGLGTKPCLNRVKIIQSVKSRYLMGIALIRAFNSQHKSRHWSWSKDNNSNSIDVSKFLTNLKLTYRYYVISLWKVKTLHFQILEIFLPHFYISKVYFILKKTHFLQKLFESFCLKKGLIWKLIFD